ncbi:MAG: lamin tail domain-containing protein [Bacteroidales bacterium]
MKKALLITISVIFSGFLYGQDCSDLFISEYVEGSGNNKALEIYNPTDQVIDLSEYRLVRYSNGGTTPNWVALGGTIQPKSVYIVVLDKRDPGGTGFEQPVDLELQAKADTFLCPVYEVNKMMYFNGNDAVTLEKDGGSTIVDIFARVGSPDPENGWTNITDTTITYNSGGVPTEYTIEDYIVGPLFWLSWTENHTLIRKPGVKQGVTQNPAVFNVAMEWDSLPENTFSNLGAHECECGNAAVSELVEGEDISFYPNPVTSELFNVEATEKMFSLDVYNTSGQAVIRQQYDGEFNLQVNTSDLNTGVYFVKVGFADNSYFVKKIIKQ